MRLLCGGHGEGVNMRPSASGLEVSTSLQERRLDTPGATDQPVGMACGVLLNCVWDEPSRLFFLITVPLACQVHPGLCVFIRLVAPTRMASRTGFQQVLSSFQGHCWLPLHKVFSAPVLRRASGKSSTEGQERVSALGRPGPSAGPLLTS